MARRYTVKTSLTFTQEMQQTLEAVSERFNVSVAQIVRECIESDLSRLVDNYKEREQNRKPIADCICTIAKEGISRGLI